MDLYGPLWTFMDLYGPLWTFMDLYGRCPKELFVADRRNVNSPKGVFVLADIADVADIIDVINVIDVTDAAYLYGRWSERTICSRC